MRKHSSGSERLAWRTQEVGTGILPEQRRTVIYGVPACASAPLTLSQVALSHVRQTNCSSDPLRSLARWDGCQLWSSIRVSAPHITYGRHSRADGRRGWAARMGAADGRLASPSSLPARSRERYVYSEAVLDRRAVIILLVGRKAAVRAPARSNWRAGCGRMPSKDTLAQDRPTEKTTDSATDLTEDIVHLVQDTPCTVVGTRCRSERYSRLRYGQLAKI